MKFFTKQAYFIKPDKLIGIVFILIFIMQIILINPAGEFPLNDDWAHYWAINNYLTTGQFIYPSILSPNMHLIIGLGIILAKIFSFSFTLMRWVNLAFALATIFLLFIFLRCLKISPLISFLLSLTLWFNPIFFNLSYTFMGDIPALFFFLAAAFSFYFGLEKKKYSLIFLGAMLSVAGFFIRQFNILLILAVVIDVIFIKRKDFNLKKITLNLGVPMFILLVIYFLFHSLNWLPSSKTMLIFHLWQGAYIFSILERPWLFILSFSFFLSPVAFSLLARNYKFFFGSRQKLTALVLLILVIFTLLFISLLQDVDWRSLSNIINDYGLGPNLNVLPGQLAHWGNGYLISFINLLVISSFVILFYFAFFYRSCGRSFFKGREFICWFIISYLIILFLLKLNFDRYLLLLLPLLFIYFARILGYYRWSKYVFTVVLLIILLYSGIGTYNYLAWNKVRWTLGNALLEQGVLAQDIAGGNEWNGWHLSSDQVKKNDFSNVFPIYRKYVIAFSPLNGYQTTKKAEVKGILSNIRYLYVNKMPE